MGREKIMKKNLRKENNARKKTVSKTEKSPGKSFYRREIIIRRKIKRNVWATPFC